MGHFHPENILSNKLLEELDIGTTDQWIMERVGIQNRRTVLPLDYIRRTKNVNPFEAFAVRQYTNSQMSAKAATDGSGTRRLKPRIWTLISGSSSPDIIPPGGFSGCR